MMKFIEGDKAALNIYGFLVAKGLLLAEGVPKKPMAKLNIREVMRVGLEIEPRVLEVLPAALLHFPRSFTNQKALPDKVAVVIDHIRRGEKVGPDLAGIKYADMRRWANIEMKDNRVVPVDEKRVMKSIRLKKSTLKLLSARAKTAKVTETEMIERLIMGKND
jgi:hypothetical protein